MPHLTLLLLFTFVFYSIDDSETNPIKKHSPKRVYLPTVILNFATGICLVSCLMPWHVLIKQGDKTLHKPTLTLAYQNVNINNATPNRAIAALTATNPDIMVLIEAGGQVWQNELAHLANHYPMHCGVNENSPFAMQVYAKEAKTKCAIVKLEGVALAKLTLADNRILYVVHPPPPISQMMAQARNDYLQALATLIKEESSNKIMVIGDFNLSAFSPIYRDFIADSAAAERALKRTTVTGLPTWLPFGIGIDHVLTTENTDNVQTHALGWQGSDHRGFVVKW